MFGVLLIAHSHLQLRLSIDHGLPAEPGASPDACTEPKGGAMHQVGSGSGAVGDASG